MLCEGHFFGYDLTFLPLYLGFLFYPCLFKLNYGDLFPGWLHSCFLIDLVFVRFSFVIC